MQTEVMEKEILEVYITPTALNVVSEAKTLSQTVKTLTITNNKEHQNSGEFLKKIKSISNTMQDRRKEITAPLDESKKRVMDFFRGPLDELSEAERILKRAILTYQQEQARIAEEERKKAEARAKAEEEKKRKILEERAIKAEVEGKESKAEALREQALDVYVPTVVKAPVLEKVQGISTKKVWKANIVDINKIPQNVYINDEKVTAAIQAILNKLATATKGAMPIEGVEFYQEESLSAGRG